MMMVIAGLGAIVGSMARFALLELAPKVFGRASVWMVMVINLTSAFLMGIAFGLSLTTSASLFWATGILGGYSTFSTPVVELADALSDPAARWRVLGKTVLAFGGGIPLLLLGVWVASNL